MDHLIYLWGQIHDCVRSFSARHSILEKYALKGHSRCLDALKPPLAGPRIARRWGKAQYYVFILRVLLTCI
jgi:hypothetical protein